MLATAVSSLNYSKRASRVCGTMYPKFSRMSVHFARPNVSFAMQKIAMLHNSSRAIIYAKPRKAIVLFCIFNFAPNICAGLINDLIVLHYSLPDFFSLRVLLFLVLCFHFFFTLFFSLLLWVMNSVKNAGPLVTSSLPSLYTKKRRNLSGIKCLRAFLGKFLL